LSAFKADFSDGVATENISFGIVNCFTAAQRGNGGGAGLYGYTV
jgi:hypothetical protein